MKSIKSVLDIFKYSKTKQGKIKLIFGVDNFLINGVLCI